MDFKKKVIGVLLTGTVLLLLVNVIMEFLNKKPEEEIVKGKTVNQLDSIFVSTLHDFGIEDDWITKRNINSKDNDSLNYNFRVKIPSSVSIPVILSRLNKDIDDPFIKITSAERKNFGSTDIQIYSNKVLKLYGSLILDDKIKRERSAISFIVDRTQVMDSTELKRILRMPFPLAVIFIPSPESKSNLSIVKEYEKDFIVQIDDGIEGPKFELKPDFEKGRLRSAVRAIISAYKNAALFVVNTNSDLFKSPVYNFISDEFKRYEKSLKLKRNIAELKGSSYDELKSRFKFYCENKEEEPNRILIIDANDFISLRDEIEKYRLKGNKFLLVSKMLQIKSMN
jgi:hypothetical protein